MKYKTMTIKATELAALRILRDEFMNRSITEQRKRKEREVSERRTMAWEMETMRVQPMRRVK